MLKFFVLKSNMSSYPQGTCSDSNIKHTLNFNAGFNMLFFLVLSLFCYVCIAIMLSTSNK